jgi:hypothetical protein
MTKKSILYLVPFTSAILVCFLIIGSSATLASQEQNASNNYSSINNEFPYPRGTAPAYGYMGCESGNTCISGNATLVHFGWTASITPQEFVDNVTKAKKLGVSNYIIVPGGPEMSSENFWKEVKELGVTDKDFFGVYFPDEPTDPSKIIAMHTAMKKYFPNAVAGDYLGDMASNGSTEFIPGLDIAFFTGYTIFHDRPHAWTYGNLITNEPAWKKAGKTVYLTTETFGNACKVTASNPSLNTSQKVSDRQTSQIVMGILGGAQGVFSYANKYAKDTPCDTGWANFRPKYEQVWPWIMNGNRTLLTTKVTSGRTNINSDPGGTISAVTAYIFTDADGRKLVASSSMLDFTEANGVVNKATINGMPNGIYDVLWENRTVNVTDGNIKDTWQPCEYHFYQLNANDTGNN